MGLLVGDRWTDASVQLGDCRLPGLARDRLELCDLTEWTEWLDSCERFDSRDRWDL